MKSVFVIFFFAVLFFGMSVRPENDSVCLLPGFPTPNPTDQYLNRARNEVNGVGIGTAYAEVLERFGKPVSIKTKGENPCGGRKTQVRFEGIEFSFDPHEEKKNIVVLIEITSPKWELSPGVRVGNSMDEVRDKMNGTGKHSKDAGFDVLGYGDGDGYLTFYFRDNKLIRITRDLNLC